MSKIDTSNLTPRTGSVYPGALADMVKGRSSLRLGDAGGLTQFGANLVMLEPGALSSLRHWHENEDEFVMVTTGVCTLIDETGETPLAVGECAAFPAGRANGHHFRNDTNAPAAFLVIGSRAATEVCHYSDVDLHLTMSTTPGAEHLNFTTKAGEPLTAGASRITKPAEISTPGGAK